VSVHDWKAPLNGILEAGVRRYMPPTSTPICILCITGGADLESKIKDDNAESLLQIAKFRKKEKASGFVCLNRTNKELTNLEALPCRPIGTGRDFSKLCTKFPSSILLPHCTNLELSNIYALGMVIAVSSNQRRNTQ
jgi:hypothetical protein